MLGRWISHLRKAHGWTQKDLARLINVDRTTLAKWEVEIERIPPRKLEALARVLEVELDLLPAQGPTRAPILGLPKRRMLVPPYPIKGTLEEMLSLGPIARQLAKHLSGQPALDLELQERFPRDSPLELLAAYHLLAAGASLEFWSTDELRCPLLVTEFDSYKSAGAGLRHALVWRLPEATMLLLPQVPLAVVSQSRRYRPDFLVLYIGKNNFWVDKEIDGKFHLDTADADARRAHGLRLPCRRYSTSVLLRADFPQRLLNDVRQLDATWQS